MSPSTLNVKRGCDLPSPPMSRAPCTADRKARRVCFREWSEFFYSKKANKILNIFYWLTKLLTVAFTHVSTSIFNFFLKMLWHDLSNQLIAKEIVTDHHWVYHFRYGNVMSIHRFQKKPEVACKRGLIAKTDLIYYFHGCVSFGQGKCEEGKRGKYLWKGEIPILPR